ncbi:NmrA family NAD(P)-binding protein [Deinococcus oregonensis]|uniref:NmrA family NAD(P)-binding protein n=1 Tax=Deinococcus oregonensis TaxID=1805970 RepID=A0ABV6B4C7_9DEIO
MQQILVIGATGTQGAPVARQLLAAGYTVRVLARVPEKAQDLTQIGAQVVQGDLSDPASLDAALHQMDGLFFLVPFSAPPSEALQYGMNVIEAATRANLQLIVWNPTGDIPDEPTGNPAVDVRLTLLNQLDASHLPYIALQPTGYMENFLGPWTRPEVVTQNTFAYPLPNTVQFQLIATEDVASFVVSAFAHPHIAPRTIKLAGPERLNIEGIATRFSQGLGRPIEFRSMPPREFGDKLEAVLPGAGDMTAQVYEGAYLFPERFSTNVDVQAALSLLPVKLTSLEEWVRQHAAQFSPEKVVLSGS